MRRQFLSLDTDHFACFLFPESVVSQFFVVTEVCKRAEEFKRINNLFPDEEKPHFSDELEFFLSLTRTIMPFFQWLYTDISMYEEMDGYITDWRLRRTKIRTKLTAEGIIKPRWKHELSLFQAVRKLCPDTLYQYRPEWLGRQSLDLYIPSRKTAIEYQGIQHYHPVDFFGAEEALAARQKLDEVKRQCCKENGVELIEWHYSDEPTADNIRTLLDKQIPGPLQ